jgi:hypothetical protein
MESKPGTSPGKGEGGDGAAALAAGPIQTGKTEGVPEGDSRSGEHILVESDRENLKEKDQNGRTLYHGHGRQCCKIITPDARSRGTQFLPIRFF